MNICSVYSTVLQYAVNYMYNEDCMLYINTNNVIALYYQWEHSSDTYICEINNYYLHTVQNNGGYYFSDFHQLAKLLIL